MQAGSRADEQSGGGEAEEGEGVGGGTQHGAASGDRLGESRERWARGIHPALLWVSHTCPSSLQGACSNGGAARGVQAGGQQGAAGQGNSPHTAVGVIHLPLVSPGSLQRSEVSAPTLST